MVRCGCSSDRCGCNFVAGDGVTISGIGSQSNPYVVEVVPSVSGGGGGSGRFVGELIPSAGSITPPGCLPCDGAAVSRTVYSALFAVIGVAYGAGDGTTTFNVPNTTGRFLVGTSGSHPRGEVGGVESAALTTANLPTHSHTINHTHAATSTTASGAHQHTFPAYRRGNDAPNPGGDPNTYRQAENIAPSGELPASGEHTHPVNIPAYTGTSGAVGSATPVSKMPPFIAVNYFIKY